MVPILRILPNFIVVQSADGNNRAATNHANLMAGIRQIRDLGGGTLLLKAGLDTNQRALPFYLDQSIIIDTERVTVTKDDGTVHTYDAISAHIRIAGETLINVNDARSEAHICWQGPANLPVFDVRHSRDITLENVLITADSGYRFLYGVFFHRTLEKRDPAPSALNLIDCLITAGLGAFTCGVRVQQITDLESIELDSNCDSIYMENVAIIGASDDPMVERASPPATPPRKGINACGIRIDGSQVQHNFFRNLYIHDCGTGVFVSKGQICCVGGNFANNHQQQVLDNASDGGDFVFSNAYAAGQLIQDVTSYNSRRFLTVRDMAEAKSNYNSRMIVAITLAGNRILSVTDPQGYAFHADAGGPFTFVDCSFGSAGGSPLRCSTSAASQVICCFWRCTFNHASGNPLLADYIDLPVEDRNADFARYADRPSAAILDSFALDQGQTVALPVLGDPLLVQHYRPALPAGAAPPYAAISGFTSLSFPADQVVNILDKTGMRPTTDSSANYLDVDWSGVINAQIEIMGLEGGILLFPSGIYNLRSAIKFSSVRNVHLVGVGGRTSVLGSGHDNFKGTAFAWQGASAESVVQFNNAHNCSLEKFFFMTSWSPGEVGQPPIPGEMGERTLTVDAMIHVRAGCEAIQIRHCSCGWLNSGGSAKNTGVANSFVLIDEEDGAPSGAVNCLALAGNFCAGQVVKIDSAGTAPREFVFLVGSNSNRQFYVTGKGGYFKWVGGASGNTGSGVEGKPGVVVGQFDDPVVVRLDTVSGPVYIGGIEVQDTFPMRLLQTSRRALDATGVPDSGRLFFYGSNYYVAASSTMLDFAFERGVGQITPELFLYGSQFAFPQSGWFNKQQLIVPPISTLAQIRTGRTARAFAFGMISEAGDHRAPEPMRIEPDHDDIPWLAWRTSNRPDASWFQDVCARGTSMRMHYIAGKWGPLSWPFETRSRSFLNRALLGFALEARQNGVDAFPQLPGGAVAINTLQLDVPISIRWWRPVTVQGDPADRAELFFSPNSLSPLAIWNLVDSNGLSPRTGISADTQVLVTNQIMPGNANGDLPQPPYPLELRLVRADGVVLYRRTVMLV